MSDTQTPVAERPTLGHGVRVTSLAMLEDPIKLVFVAMERLFRQVVQVDAARRAEGLSGVDFSTLKFSYDKPSFAAPEPNDGEADSTLFSWEARAF